MPVMTMNAEVRTRFGTRMRELRKARGLKQEALGDALGYSRSMVSEIEKGHQAPPLDKAVAIAEYFGIPLDALVKEEAQPHPQGSFVNTTSILLAASAACRVDVVLYLRAMADDLACTLSAEERKSLKVNKRSLNSQ